MASKQSAGSPGSQQTFNKLVEQFGPLSASTKALNEGGSGEPTQPTVSDVAPFVASDVLNKVALLGIIALVFGIGAAFFKVSPVIGFVAMLVSFGFVLISFFKPAAARITAPLYSVFMGIGLGVISRSYAQGNSTVVPLAIVATTVVFFAVLFLYRTGLVKVGSAFVRATVIATVGLLAAALVSIIFGMVVSFAHQSLIYLVIFGYMYLIVGVMNLFVDFAYVYKAQQAGVSKEGEWFAAQSIMISMVMIYLALLTIFTGGNR